MFAAWRQLLMHTTIPLAQRLISLSREMIARGSTIAASAMLDRLLTLHDLATDTRREALLSLAVIHHEAGRIRPARRVLAVARKLFPDDGDILIRLSLVCLDDPRCGLDTVQCVLKRAAKVLPQNPRIRLHLGIVCDKLGDVSAARRHLRAAVAGIHNEPTILPALVDALLDRGFAKAAKRLVGAMRFRLTPHVWQRLDRNLNFRLVALRQQARVHLESPSVLTFELGESRREVSTDGGILRFDRGAMLRPYLAGATRVRRSRYVP